MSDANITGAALEDVDRLREIVASAHAIRCTCEPGALDARCQALQALAQEAPRTSEQDLPMNCAQCGTLTPVKDVASVYLGKNAWGQDTYGLKCLKCRGTR